MAESERKDAYSVDEARMEAGANQCTKRFIAKIQVAASDRKHRARLTSCKYCVTEEQAAFYDLERMGFRVERVKSHHDNKTNAVIQDSFYAFW